MIVESTAADMVSQVGSKQVVQLYEKEGTKEATVSLVGEAVAEDTDESCSTNCTKLAGLADGAVRPDEMFDGAFDGTLARSSLVHICPCLRQPVFEAEAGGGGGGKGGGGGRIGFATR